MGNINGKITNTKTLASASAPPLDGVTLPKIQGTKKCDVTASRDYQKGETFNVIVNGAHQTIKCPKNVVAGESFTVQMPTTKPWAVTVSRAYKQGEKLTVFADGVSGTFNIPKNVKAGERLMVHLPISVQSSVYASTLQTIPGMKVVLAKQIICATVMEAFRGDFTASLSQLSSKLASLVEEAHNSLLKQCLECDCNAVLGIAHSVANDSSGDTGHFKILTVTATGTPCVVMAETSNLTLDTCELMPSAPLVYAEAVVVMDDYKSYKDDAA